MELISPVIKCFSAACLDPQCRSIKCTRCKQAVTMTGLIPFDASCLLKYTNGRTSTTGKNRSLETYLRMNLVEIIEYASFRKTIHRGCTLTKRIRVNWMNFDDSWTSYIDLAESDHPRVHILGGSSCMV